MRVDEVCSHALHHVSATCTLREAAQLMRDRRASSLFVTEQDGPYQRILAWSRTATWWCMAWPTCPPAEKPLSPA